MQPSARKTAKTVLTLVAVLWMAVVGWVQFKDISQDDTPSQGSTVLQQRMKDECYGNFKQRYQCKDAIVVKSGQEFFFEMTKRMLIVCLGPFAAAFVFSRYCKPDPVHFTVADTTGGDWKQTAQRNVQTPDDYDDAPPPPRANAPSGGGSMDWKKAAQQRISNQSRPPGEG
jgi:hypothetical protein